MIVSVENHDGAAARVVEPGGQCDLVAEVARQREDAHAPVGRGRRLERLRGPIGAAVVDEDQLERYAGQRPDDPAVELADECRLVEHRGDDAHKGHRARAANRRDLPLGGGLMCFEHSGAPGSRRSRHRSRPLAGDARRLGGDRHAWTRVYTGPATRERWPSG
jgi:hypothetical protein